MDEDPPEPSDTTPEQAPRPDRMETAQRSLQAAATGLELLAEVLTLVNANSLASIARLSALSLRAAAALAGRALRK